eukprot:1986202-Rhodomonas_salina.1
MLYRYRGDGDHKHVDLCSMVTERARGAVHGSFVSPSQITITHHKHKHKHNHNHEEDVTRTGRR